MIFISFILLVTLGYPERCQSHWFHFKLFVVALFFVEVVQKNKEVIFISGKSLRSSSIFQNNEVIFHFKKKVVFRFQKHIPFHLKKRNWGRILFSKNVGRLPFSKELRLCSIFNFFWSSSIFKEIKVVFHFHFCWSSSIFKKIEFIFHYQKDIKKITTYNNSMLNTNLQPMLGSIIFIDNWPRYRHREAI